MTSSAFASSASARRPHGVDAWYAGELGEGMILDDQKKRPEEIGKETAPKNDDQDREVLPKIQAMMRNELNACYLGDGFACSEPVGEAALMMPAKMATARPLPKEKSRSPASARSSLKISCSFE